MGRHLMNDAEAIGSWSPPPLDTPYGLLTFGAQFARSRSTPTSALSGSGSW